MKASRFSDAQKAFILKQGSDGMPGGYLPQGGHQPGDLFQLETAGYSTASRNFAIRF
jgi:hypothetical protein